jgi:hypothetical protein
MHDVERRTNDHCSDAYGGGYCHGDSGACIRRSKALARRSGDRHGWSNLRTGERAAVHDAVALVGYYDTGRYWHGDYYAGRQRPCLDEDRSGHDEVDDIPNRRARQGRGGNSSPSYFSPRNFTLATRRPVAESWDAGSGLSRLRSASAAAGLHRLLPDSGPMCCRLRSDRVLETAPKEHRAPALAVIQTKLDVVTLPLHAGDDVANAAPVVEQRFSATSSGSVGSAARKPSAARRSLPRASSSTSPPARPRFAASVRCRGQPSSSAMLRRPIGCSGCGE